MKSIIFIEEPIEIQSLMNLDYELNNLNIIPLSIRAQVYLKNESINYNNSTEYFDNNAHERCLHHSKKIISCVEKKFNYKYKGQSFNAVIDWFANGIRHGGSNYITFLIEVINSALKKHKPDIVYISKFSQPNNIGWLLNINEYYHPEICKKIAFNYKLKTKEILVKNNKDLTPQIDSNYQNNYSKKQTKLLQKLGRKGKIILLTNLGYNMHKVMSIIRKSHKNVKFIVLSKREKNLFKYFYYRFVLNTIFIDYSIPKINSSIIDFDPIIRILTDELEFNGVNYFSIIEKKLINIIIPNVEQMAIRCNAVNEKLKVINPKLTISYHSRGVSKAIGEICKNEKLNSFCISHGTVVPPQNNNEKIVNKSIGKAVILNDYSAVAIQSEWANQFLDYYGSKSERINTGPLIFTKLRKKNYKKKKKILYASTFKNKSNLKFWGVETPDEYLSTLSDLIKIFKGLQNYELIVKLHPSFFYECNIRQAKDILNPSKNIKFSSKKLYSEMKNATMVISYSSTVIEESLINKIPVLLYDKWKRYCHYPCKNLDSGNFSRDSLYYTTKSESIKKYINKIAEVSKSDDLDWGKYYSTNKSHPDFNSYLDRVLN